MSRRGQLHQQPVAGPSGLPRAKVPLEQLSQIQKRLQALLQSTGELQLELAVAPQLDWSALLSRYGTLISQTYSLSSSLTSPSSAFLPSQIDAVHRYLSEDARSSNYFMSDQGEGSMMTTAELRRIPDVHYTDRQRNTLPNLAVVPVVPVDGEKTARLGEALRTKLDPQVTQSQDELLGAYPLDLDESKPDSSVSLTPEEAEEAAVRKLTRLLAAKKVHDQFSKRALRSWHHVRWRPDEAGDAYDFKMRLGADDTGEADDEGEDETLEADEEVTQEVADGVGDDGPEAVEAEKEEAGEEDDDEDMEEVET